MTRFRTPTAAPSPYARYGRPSDLAYWLLTALLLGIVVSCWALGVPRFGVPDENDHARKAAATVRGETIGEETDLPGGYRLLRFPGSLAAGQPDCFNFDSDTTAACQTFEGSPTGEVEGALASGLYPPWPYVVPGLPTLVWDDARVVWVMRLFAAAVCCAAVGVAAVWARRTARPDLSLLGFVGSLTPMALFLFGSVNPSGQEIAWFIAAWCGLLLVATAEKLPRGRVLVALGFVGAAAVLTRQLSPLWLVLAVVVAALAARPGRIGEIARTRSAWVAAGIVAVAGVAQMGWLAWSGLLGFPPDERVAVDAPASEVWRTVLGQGWPNVQEMVGRFGWLDVPTPTVAVLVWFGLVGAVVIPALLLCSRRVVAALLVTMFATWFLPVVLEVREVASAGYWWQGRYTLPFAVGIPLVAGFGLAAARANQPGLPNRVRTVVALGFAVAQTAGLYVTLRRFTVGLDGPLLFFDDEEWSPPVPSWILLVVVAVASVLFVAWVLSPANRAPLDPPKSIIEGADPEALAEVATRG
jgi:Predicted membrane protein (DUF2142)